MSSGEVVIPGLCELPPSERFSVIIPQPEKIYNQVITAQRNAKTQGCVFQLGETILQQFPYGTISAFTDLQHDITDFWTEVQTAKYPEEGVLARPQLSIKKQALDAGFKSIGVSGLLEEYAGIRRERSEYIFLGSSYTDISGYLINATDREFGKITIRKIVPSYKPVQKELFGERIEQFAKVVEVVMNSITENQLSARRLYAGQVLRFCPQKR